MFNYKLRSKNIMLVFMTGIFLYSCFDSKPNQNVEIFYFDLAGYFNDQIKELEENQVQIEKLLITSQDTQRVYIDYVNWQEELTPFLGSDINKPAWRDSYLVDTASNGKDIISIGYKSSEDKLPVKEIRIHFKNNNVEHVFIESNKSNYIYNSAQVLSYSPKSGYTMEGEQDIVLGKDLHYKVIVNFLNH